jgi:hypothetical protein
MYTLHTILLVSPLVLAQPMRSQCDHSVSGTRTSISGTRDSNDDNASATSISFIKSDGLYCISATIVGRLKYSDAEDDVIDMPFGGHAVFRERTPSDDRELTITRGQSGELLHLFRHNGAKADSPARSTSESAAPPICSRPFMPRAERPTT